MAHMKTPQYRSNLQQLLEQEKVKANYRLICYCCSFFLTIYSHMTPTDMCIQQNMWAERREFPLPAYVGVHSFAPSLKVIPDSSAQRPLSAHLKFHSAPVKSLYARSNLKEGAIPEVAPIWPVCLLYEIFYKFHVSTNDLLEGTRESVWTCACPRLVESGIGAELERNGTIAWPLD